jgi:4-amino-4-deoxy-L-arabinose transferase-like glycosyltransferase
VDQYYDGGNRVRRTTGLGLGLLVVFLLLEVYGLDRVPTVHQDESWIAAPGLTFWREGRFGSDLFRGFAGEERHVYEFMPVFSLAVGGLLAILGGGLASARLVAALCATLTLWLTFVAADRLVSRRCAMLSMFVLLAWPIVAADPFGPTGIPVFDLGRIARYDIGVPVFGLAALLVILPAIAGRGQHSNLHLAGRGLAAGVLVALASLTHAYGAAWLPALLAAGLWSHDGVANRRRLFLGVGAGFLITLLPWLWFVAGGWPDFVAQNRPLGDRLDLLNWRFFAGNLLTEWQRYEPIAQSAVRGQPATWVWLATFGTGLAALIRMALRERLPTARVLLACTATLVGLFALVLQPRSPRYLATIWPLFAIVAATGAIDAWDRFRSRAARSLVVLLAAAASVEGGWSYAALAAKARASTPYPLFCDKLAAHLPHDGLVMGLPHFWLGLDGKVADYRALLVAIYATDARFTTAPVSLKDAFDRQRPDVILIDERMREFIRDEPATGSRFAGLAGEFSTWLSSDDVRLTDRVSDTTYGDVDIYVVPSPAPVK